MSKFKQGDQVRFIVESGNGNTGTVLATHTDGSVWLLPNRSGASARTAWDNQIELVPKHNMLLAALDFVESSRGRDDDGDPVIHYDIKDIKGDRVATVQSTMIDICVFPIDPKGSSFAAKAFRIDKRR